MQGSPGGGRRQPSVVVLGPVSLVEGAVLGSPGGGWIHAEGVGGICLAQERASGIPRGNIMTIILFFWAKKNGPRSKFVRSGERPWPNHVHGDCGDPHCLFICKVFFSFMDMVVFGGGAWACAMRIPWGTYQDHHPLFFGYNKF